MLFSLSSLSFLNRRGVLCMENADDFSLIFHPTIVDYVNLLAFFTECSDPAFYFHDSPSPSYSGLCSAVISSKPPFLTCSSACWDPALCHALFHITQFSFLPAGLIRLALNSKILLPSLSQRLGLQVRGLTVHL